MIDSFLLQSGNFMSTEKLACAFHGSLSTYCSYQNLSNIPKDYAFKYVPVGTVEFTRKFCDHTGLRLPEEFSYWYDLDQYIHRNIKETTLSLAAEDSFVKPRRRTKAFTGCLKKDLRPMSGETPVWESEVVPFLGEFRFYIQDYVTGPRILGWSRYDDKEVKVPEPDFAMVEGIANRIHGDLGPSSYSIDIGWREDIGRYDLVEINDGWSLGLYENSDPQSNPPTRRDYAHMLLSRWMQIVFCSLP